MEHVAAALRSRGVGSAWIGYPYSLPLRVRARLFTDATDSATTPEELAGAIASLGAHRVVDIIGSEPVMAAVAEATRKLTDLPQGEALDETVARDVVARAAWVDKLVALERLRTTGVDVPAILPAPEHDATAAAERLGLPLVVKGRQGFAGSAVRMASSVHSARKAAEMFAGHGGAYFERIVHGTEYSWVCSYGPGGQVQQEGAYQAHKSPLDPHGPAAYNVPVEVPALGDAGRRVVKAIGGRGLLNLDFIVDEDGIPWLLDVNLRPWNSVVAMRSSGVDFVAGYLHALGLGPAPEEPRVVPAGGEVHVFPREAAERLRRRPWNGGRVLARQARDWRPWTSTGYVAAGLLRSGMVIATRIYRDLMGERHWAARERRWLEVDD